MCHDSDKHTFDRVSGAEKEDEIPIIASKLQYVPNASSNTNNADDLDSHETQTSDQNQIIPDT